MSSYRRIGAIKRIWSILFWAVMTALLFSVRTFAANEEQQAVSILHEGSAVSEIVVEQTEKEVLTADFSADADAVYQWQLLISARSDQWVNISDRSGAECEVTYSLVKSLLDPSGSTYIRCAVSYEGETVYSEPVCVTILFTKDMVADMEETLVPLAPSAMMLALDDETKPYNADDYVTITINYLDGTSYEAGNYAEIYSPYMATLEKDSAFSQQVVSPTCLGFAPYYDKDGDGTAEETAEESASVINLNYDSVSKDIVINVYYHPINVKYAVRYFFQNINDDLYTEHVQSYFEGQAETGTIIADEILTENAGDTIGFEKLYHYPESVAADGSTVFECYYDRNYYLIQFDLNGGYGVEPIYARYEVPFIVNNPIRHGYEFAGWDLIDRDTDNDGVNDSGDGVAETNFPTTIPAGNRYYKALWENIQTSATIVYWLEDADSNTYNFWGSREIKVQSGDSIHGKDYADYSEIAGNLDEYEKRYSVYNSEKTEAEPEVIVAGDGSSIVNVYYDRKEYDLRFYYAMSSGSGANIKYYVIGGSTYRFGASATISDTGNEIALLDHYMWDYENGSHRGQVDELPTLNTNGTVRNYTQGTETSAVTQYTYYYLTFNAKYGADISSLWPCNVFNSVTRSYANTHGQWSGTEAFVSAWNGEHHVYYSQKNENQTIKGNYDQLDYKLLWDYSSFGDSSTVAYLCFWENGANIGWSVPKLFRYNIYVPVLAGQDTTGLTIKENDGVTYYMLATYDTCDDSSVESQTAPAITGYEYKEYTSTEITDYDKSLYKEAYDVDFYYKRHNFNLTFWNHNAEANTDASGQAIEQGEVPFGTDLTDYYFVPAYPDTLEENAYAFAGWYTTQGCYPGSDFGVFAYDEEGNYVSSSFAGYTMPANNMMLYAKWEPVEHTVNFFTTYDEMLQYESDLAAGSTVSVTPHYSVERSHGAVVGSVTNPTYMENNLSLIFAGWFYIENGEKKAFTPLDMPVHRNLNIFADWSSHEPQPYRIHYVLQGTETKVAEDTVGYAYGGATRTFTAKAGNPYNQLYPAYNNGYFPTVGSHSITMQYEEDKDTPVNNVFIFEYVHAENIEYTVRYINKSTNTPLCPDEVKSTENAVITERFKVFQDMVPDAFYKRLVISVEYDEITDNWVGTEENVITFYYTPNASSAYYAVHYMLEKLDATESEKSNYAIDGTGGYEESVAYTEGVGDINAQIGIIPQSFSGFSLIQNQAVLVQGENQTNATFNNDQYTLTITADGTELYIFYSRNECDYKVNYYQYNTTRPLADTKTGTALYGSTITEDAIEIDGYTCVSKNTTQSLVMREGTNVITFYYEPIQYTVEYVAVTEDGGTLSQTREVVLGTDAFVGSVPTAKKYYEFAGWYLDEDCTQPLSDTAEIDINSNRLIPIKDKLSKTATNTFYAKFERLKGDLTITRTNASDDKQVYIYEVTAKETGDSITVTVVGNSSTTIQDLALGEYTITQQNDWSWRHTDTAQAVDHNNATGSTVTFDDVSTKLQWLDGNSLLIRNKKGGGS